MDATLFVTAALACGVAVVTTPAGVSGAVFLLPVQVSVLGVPSPAVTPTNLLYNVVGTPGGLARFARTGKLSTRLAGRTALGALPGVAVGAFLRVEYLSGEGPFLLLVAFVLIALGAWLLLSRSRAEGSAAAAGRLGWLPPVAFAVGVVGGIYGIGGGSILAPILLAVGLRIDEVAAAALLTTFATSVVGIAVFELLELREEGAIGPDWAIGVSAGLGGLVGSYVGARLQPAVPEAALRRLLGGLAVAVGVRYLWLAAF